MSTCYVMAPFTKLVVYCLVTLFWTPIIGWSSPLETIVAILPYSLRHIQQWHHLFPSYREVAGTGNAPVRLYPRSGTRRSFLEYPHPLSQCLQITRKNGVMYQLVCILLVSYIYLYMKFVCSPEAKVQGQGLSVHQHLILFKSGQVLQFYESSVLFDNR